MKWVIPEADRVDTLLTICTNPLLSCLLLRPGSAFQPKLHFLDLFAATSPDVFSVPLGA